MPNGLPLDYAEQTLRSRVAEASQGPISFLSALEGFKQFARIQFEVPDTDDSDGCQVEYGVLQASERPEFVVHLARQFEQLSEDGDHEQYIQTYCDIAFPVDDELKALGDQAEWWFRSSGDDFDSWWRERTSSPWTQLLSQRTPSSIQFAHEVV